MASNSWQADFVSYNGQSVPGMFSKLNIWHYLFSFLMFFTHTLLFLILFLTSINHHFSPTTFTEHVHTSISQFRSVEITVTAKWWIRFYLSRVWKIPRLHFYYPVLSWSGSFLLTTDHGMTSLTITWYRPTVSFCLGEVLRWMRSTGSITLLWRPALIYYISFDDYKM